MTKLKNNQFNLDAIIKGLKCMRNIDEEFIPTFKFF